MVKQERLREIFEYLNPLVAIQKAHISPNTVKARAIQEFNKHKTTIINTLAAAQGLIHIVFDGWRAPNRLSMYGVVCFFRDEQDKPYKITLGIPEVGRHLGTIVAHEVFEILEAYEVPDNKIGYAVCHGLNCIDLGRTSIRALLTKILL